MTTDLQSRSLCVCPLADDSPAGHVHEHRRDCSHGGHFHAHHLNAHRPKQRRALLWCLIITHAVMAVELIAGYFIGSLMLISDGVHMISHAAALGVSWIAVILAQRKTSETMPFGWHRVEILAALFNSILLLGMSGWIVYEALPRLRAPAPMATTELLIVAVIGLLANGATAVILHRAGAEDLNTRSAFLHMLADLFSSVVVVAGVVVMAFTQWFILDPLLSLLVAGLIVWWAFGLLQEALHVLLEGKPAKVDCAEIARSLRREFPAIQDIHELRVWVLTSQCLCCSAHVLLEDMALSEGTRLRGQIERSLRHRFHVQHAMILIESRGVP